MADAVPQPDALTWLRPPPPRTGPVPRWVWVALCVGFVSGLVDAVAHEGWPTLVSTPLALVGLVGCAGLGHALEARWFSFHARFGLGLRTALGLFAPPAVLVLTGLVGVTAAVAGPHGVGKWALNTVTTTGFWVAGAMVGSTLILLLDTAVSRLVPGFRGRVLAAVLALLGLVSGLGVAAVFLATTVMAVAARPGGGSHFTIDLPSGPLTGKEAADLLFDHPVLVGLAVFSALFVLALPAVVTACLRLADAVVFRLEPLTEAFARVAQGQRGVRVEEAGSRDFVLANRRFNELAASLERGERMERAFGVYVSGHVLERIRAQHGEAVIPASLREASVFFADIRGFTSASEKLSPDQVVAFLNRYFARVVQVVDAHDGYLNKFIGDAVVVVFNGPVDQPDHAGRAVRCALALQDEVRRLNAAQAFPEVGELRIGVGVATGPMVCGNVGGSTQMEYTVIGDTVNLSSRLTSNAPAGEVWVNEATAAALPEGVVAEALEPLKVKGKDVPVRPSRVRWAQPTAATGAPHAS